MGCHVARFWTAATEATPVKQGTIRAMNRNIVWDSGVRSIDETHRVHRVRSKVRVRASASVNHWIFSLLGS